MKFRFPGKYLILLLIAGLIFGDAISVKAAWSATYRESDVKTRIYSQDFDKPNQISYPQLLPAPDSVVLSSSFQSPTYLDYSGWKWLQPYQVIDAPVLLYHHISDEPFYRNYAVGVEAFREQMTALKARGYESVPITYLVNAIKTGGPLPERPVVITFDDGTLDVFLNAYPVMQELGFVGTFYLVGNYIDSPDYVSTDEVQQLLAAGWEIGSHSMSHADLSKTSNLNEEVYGSKGYLEKKFNVPVNTIAYPFGMVNAQVFEKTIEYGYAGASGLGLSWEHSYSSVYYLNRIEIKYGQSIEQFNELLPW